MVSGMALPESVNFGSKWAEISDDDGKNSFLRFEYAKMPKIALFFPKNRLFFP